ncbi:MAG: transporter substrate-binding domain-containing protein [Alphaproteobacteria bacterium]|nr:transporter substrate-binding domain-containing protein [Alphaproteobacteria bacterium]
MKLIISLFIILLSFPAFAEGKESTFDRVKNTGVLRCGYGSWEPGVIKDPVSGEMKGLFVELIEEMARFSKVKVEWVSEVDWGQISQALQSGKVDAFCAGMANDAARAKDLAYSVPMSYWSFDVIVRADDERFLGQDTFTVSDLNKDIFSMSYSEGDVLETIKLTELPNVKGIPLPPLGTPADNLMNVISGKTDLVVFPRVMIQGYEKANGKGKLKLLKLTSPLRVYGNVIAVDVHETELQNFLNAGLTELLNSSTYNRIMSKYEKDWPGSFMRPTTQYVTE